MFISKQNFEKSLEDFSYDLKTDWQVVEAYSTFDTSIKRGKMSSHPYINKIMKEDSFYKDHVKADHLTTERK